LARTKGPFPPITREEIIAKHTNPMDTNEYWANKHGITRDTLFKRLRKELDAADAVAVPATDKSGEPKRDPETGQVLMRNKKMPLWGTRQKARMDAHRLLEHYPSDKLDATVHNPIPVKVYTGRPPVEEEE